MTRTPEKPDGLRIDGRRSGPVRRLRRARTRPRRARVRAPGGDPPAHRPPRAARPDPRIRAAQQPHPNRGHGATWWRPRAASASQFLAQSIAWTPPSGGEAVREHESLVLDAGGVVIRYGTFYGPGTYGGDHQPPPPRIRVDEAARATPATVALLGTESRVVDVVEPSSGPWSRSSQVSSLGARAARCALSEGLGTLSAHRVCSVPSRRAQRSLSRSAICGAP